MPLANYDFFWRTENKDKEKVFSEENARQMRLVLPDDMELEELLEEAWANGMSKGSHRSGCYEIQGPDGMWLGKNQRKINPEKPSSFRFVTWEEWDEE